MIESPFSFYRPSSLSRRILAASVPSSISVSRNHGCFRAFLADILVRGSYTNIFRSRSRNCLLKLLLGGIMSWSSVSVCLSQFFRSRSTYVKMLHSFDVFSGRLACFSVRIIEFASNEVSDMVSIETKNFFFFYNKHNTERLT